MQLMVKRKKTKGNKKVEKQENCEDVLKKETEETKGKETES